MGALLGLVAVLALAVLVLGVRLARLRRKYAAIVDVDLEVAKRRRLAMEDAERLQRSAEATMTRALDEGVRIRESSEREMQVAREELEMELARKREARAKSNA